MFPARAHTAESAPHVPSKGPPLPLPATDVPEVLPPAEGLLPRLPWHAAGPSAGCAALPSSFHPQQGSFYTFPRAVRAPVRIERRGGAVGQAPPNVTGSQKKKAPTPGPWRRGNGVCRHSTTVAHWGGGPGGWISRTIGSGRLIWLRYRRRFFAASVSLPTAAIAMSR